MIPVTRLNGEKINLNAELIESVESRPDTLITLVTGNRLNVCETPDQIVELVKEYRRDIGKNVLEEVRRMIIEEKE
ncbi:MAG: flagellar FlbD family protein [Elusimicrobia bacterium]|nr:flagellar FlbD family protein [Elusimicrobiota bacterium]